ncbi:hypothetical protein DFH06DRAFT_1013271 [Mycena polygramma]|nr:hypothetical protein DFH06DRAFT_1013271 [Mycena polygramma]
MIAHDSIRRGQQKPRNVSFDQAASFPITFPTAAVGLCARAPIGLGLNPTLSWDKPQQGSSGLVTGAGMSTGQFAVQLLRFLGFTRIVVYASKAHFTYLKTLGVTEFINPPEIALNALVLSPPVQVVYDATPVGALKAAYASVVDGGKVPAVHRHPVVDSETRGGVTLVRCFGFYAEGRDFGVFPVFILVRSRMADILQLNRIDILPKGLAGIQAGLERIKSGAVSGVKLVAHPQDTTD